MTGEAGDFKCLRDPPQAPSFKGGRVTTVLTAVTAAPIVVQGWPAVRSWIPW
jgi:hypothetical protein